MEWTVRAKVIERRPRRDAEPQENGGVAVVEAESVIIHVGNETVTEVHLEIIDQESGGRVETVIEFLSPANKTPGAGQELYQRKQQEVPLDLQRASRWPTPTTPTTI
jgi:hypothetical protein